jgi:hypothetical protein
MGAYCSSMWRAQPSAATVVAVAEEGALVASDVAKTLKDGAEAVARAEAGDLAGAVNAAVAVSNDVTKLVEDGRNPIVPMVAVK